MNQHASDTASPDAASPETGFAAIEDAIAAIGRGEMIVVVDDEDRENEGDIIFAAERCTPELISFLAREARGLVCVSAERDHLERLELALFGRA